MGCNWPASSIATMSQSCCRLGSTTNKACFVRSSSAEGTVLAIVTSLPPGPSTLQFQWAPGEDGSPVGTSGFRRWTTRDIRGPVPSRKPPLKGPGEAAAEDVRPAAAARRRRFPVVDGQVPLEFRVGVEEPVQSQHDIVEGRALHPLVLKIEIAVADADLPGAPAGFPAPDVEVAPRDDVAERRRTPVVGLAFAREEVEQL